MAWAPDHPDVKIKNHGLGQYGTEPHYSTLPLWQLCALKGKGLTSTRQKMSSFLVTFFPANLLASTENEDCPQL